MDTIDQKVRKEFIEKLGSDLMSHPETLPLMSSIIDDLHVLKVKKMLQQCR